jgi:hypothetical protein
MTAYKYNPNSGGLFWIGNIAPDCISGWKEKDRLHLRDREDRLNALGEMALTADLHDDLSRGIILHLYLDYKWDISSFKRYFEEHRDDDNWLLNYRNEISLASAWYYHHLEWSRQVWDDMMECTEFICDKNFGYSSKDITDYIHRVYKWHDENNIGPSSVYDPDFIEEFTDKAMTDFRNWLTEYEINQ